MSKDSSGKYYQNSEKNLHKKVVKDIKGFLSKEKKKSNTMVKKDTKIYQNMKNKSLFSVEKNMKWEKTPFYSYKKYLF